MASYPASSRPPVETESAVFAKVAALLLGILLPCSASLRC